MTVNDIDQLLDQLRRADPTAPRLTWYGRGGERVELSGRVLDNWAAKTANFLSEEFDAEPGSRIALVMPPHWKSLCIALGALSTGAYLEPVDPDTERSKASSCQSGLSRPLVAVTSAPADLEPLAQEAEAVIAVALPALALGWPGQLAQRQHDYAREIRMFADAFDRFDDPAPQDPALPGVNYAEVKNWALSVLPDEMSPDPAAPRIGLLAVQKAKADGELLPPAGMPLLVLIRHALAIWWQGGSIVLFEDPADMSEAALDAERARLLKG
ncbi:TIGR03089 family protein [Acaricomes phytoseiuli]|uniref:TIGR03089 family protein n=1 Tax=Acaricomes phytoseiuli TaxID=291968 RepID=UPI0003723DF4|nr:TIGR03089 family protein [Acaricomes phytoseiuli]MCW1249875.1 TIGR03089 family protein [Acaricomes phytoseiuli]